MLAFGDSEGCVTMLQIVNNEEVARFETEVGRVTKIDFSENGYHMLVHGNGNMLEVWDLRKNEQAFKQIKLNHNIKGACFDNSGRFLLASDVNHFLFDCKKFDNLATFKLDIENLTVLR